LKPYIINETSSVVLLLTFADHAPSTASLLHAAVAAAAPFLDASAAGAANITVPASTSGRQGSLTQRAGITM
jgi:hypothetical protein